MSLNDTQLNAIIAHALPSERLKDARELSEGRYALALANGERLDLYTYHTTDDVMNASTALRLLRGEIDLPIPQLRAADETGAASGQPYILISEVTGEPLAQAIEQITDEPLYVIGRRLGAVIGRVHQLAVTSYGRFVGGTGGHASDERSYTLKRLDYDLARCEANQLLDSATSNAVREWFADTFQPASHHVALLHGNLTPENILVRQTRDGWRLSGLLGWERALGWVPAWEHTVLLDATNAAHYFGLRVGYGNGYDDQTERTYEQVRERALTPYRLLLALERLLEHSDEGDFQHYRQLIESALRLLHSEEPRTAEL